MAKFSLKSMTLAQQGIILVICLLCCELLFLGTLGWLLTQAESEADRQAMARDIDDKASRLLLTVYDTGDAVGKYTRTLEFGNTKRFDSSKEEVAELVTSLKHDLQGQSEPERLLSRIEENIAICLPVMTAIKNESIGLSREDAQQVWRDKRRPIVGNVDVMIADLTSLMKYSRKIEQEAPDIEREQREMVRRALVVGLLANMILGVIIAGFFTGRIVARLNVLVDNADLLKKGEPLHEPLSGGDEIAQVDAVFHATADVLRREEQMLKASEARVRAIIENVPVGILVVNAKGGIEFTNTAIENTFAYADHELQGKNITKLFPPSKAAARGQIIDELSQRALGHIIELQAQRKNSKVFPIDFTLADITIGGEKKRMAMILDASERYELKQLRQSFVTMVSEELRNPLTKVSSFFRRFGDGQLGEIPEKAVDQCLKSEQNIERLITLLNDLFDLEKIEAGKIDINPSRCNMQTILDKSLNAVAMFADKHKVSLQIAPVDMPVYADANRIVQVLVNLLSNAIKFSAPQSTVTVAVKQQDQQVELQVIDQGRGIPANQIDSVFEKFRQVEPGDGKRKGGTGLGLAICRAIIEEHQGTIGVNSEEGKGSTFWIRLPMEANPS